MVAYSPWRDTMRVFCIRRVRGLGGRRGMGEGWGQLKHARLRIFSQRTSCYAKQCAAKHPPAQDPITYKLNIQPDMQITSKRKKDNRDIRQWQNRNRTKMFAQMQKQVQLHSWQFEFSNCDSKLHIWSLKLQLETSHLKFTLDFLLHFRLHISSLEQETNLKTKMWNK